jgi:hypothetical protein
VCPEVVKHRFPNTLLNNAAVRLHNLKNGAFFPKLALLNLQPGAWSFEKVCCMTLFYA